MSDLVVKYTLKLTFQLKYGLKILIIWYFGIFNRMYADLIKGVPNMILVKVICYVDVENHFLTFTKHITFTRIMLGMPFID